MLDDGICEIDVPNLTLECIALSSSSLLRVRCVISKSRNRLCLRRVDSQDITTYVAKKSCLSEKTHIDNQLVYCDPRNPIDLESVDGIMLPNPYRVCC